jgi:hypothetical protein
MKVLSKIEIPSSIKREYQHLSFYENWSQIYTNEKDSGWFIEYYKSQIKLPKISSRQGIEHTVLTHVFRTCIEQHSDDMCKKTMLIPLVLTGDVVLHCGKSKKKLTVGVPVVFNDRQVHWVTCSDQKAYQTIISVDYRVKEVWN